MSPKATRIGVISDTHGFLDASVADVFAGVDHIIHAGDVMDPAILEALCAVAPVTAVQGNLDAGELAASLPRDAAGEVQGISFVVSHKRKRLMKRLGAGRLATNTGRLPQLVVFGHDHIPSAAWVDGSLFLNPGTASAPDDEDDDPTVAIVQAAPAGLAVEFVPLPRRIEAAQRR
jgi:uncharacterized protein